MNRMEKLQEILKFHRGSCQSCQHPNYGGHCIPERLIMELIDEERKLQGWRKFT